MLTWKLWYALQRPPTRNPLFLRAYRAPEQPAAWYVGCAQWFGIVLVLPLLAYAGLLYGIGWSVGISNLIGKERAQGTFDLISLAPSGPLGMSWAIATGYLYHHRTFHNIVQTTNILVRVLLMAALYVGVDFLLTEVASVIGFPLSYLPVRYVTLAAALYIDQYQSLVLAALVGITMPVATKDQMQAQLYTFAAYLGIQVAAYLLVFLIGFSALPALLDAMRLNGVLVDALLMVTRLLILVAAREVMIGALWNILKEHINADRREIDGLVRDRKQKVPA